MSLDMASLVAAPSTRRVRGADPDIIAEIRGPGHHPLCGRAAHLVGAGSAEGAIDAANIMKPALGRGELQMIRRHYDRPNPEIY